MKIQLKTSVEQNLATSLVINIAYTLLNLKKMRRRMMGWSDSSH